jgi:hypothetical protein
LLPAADRSTEGREVFGADHHGPTVDQTRSGDDPVGRDVTADEGADLPECPGVEERLDARAGVEFAPRPVLRQPLGTAHGACSLPPPVQIVERGSPLVHARTRHALERNGAAGGALPDQNAGG